MTTNRMSECELSSRTIIRHSVIRHSSFTSCGGWSRTNIGTFRASHPTVRRPRIVVFQFTHKARREGVEPSSSASKADDLPLVDPQKCPAGVEPASPAWKAGTSAARSRAHEAEGEGVEPSRLIARLFSRQLPSPIGLPFRCELR